MSFLVTVSDTPMLLDTMPALKLTCWEGCPARDTVYSYGKLSFCGGALKLGGWIFDGAPAPSQRFSAVFQFSPDTFLCYTVSPQGKAAASLVSKNGSVPLSGTEAPHMGAGCDEQGPYWSFEVIFPKEFFLSHFGKAPAPQSTFFGNLFLYDTEEEAFGSAFPARKNTSFPFQESLGSFTAVPY